MKSEITYNSQIISTAPYTKLAFIFDDIMENVNYRRWAKYIHAILKKEKIRDGYLMDIGCGTGQLLTKLLKTNYLLVGCDSSLEMLKVSRKKLKGIKFFQSSLPYLKDIPQGKYNIILCLFDTMNYLMFPSTLVESFKNIYDKLTCPGIFIFDIVTKEHCEKYFQNFSEKEVLQKKVAYSRKSFYDDKKNIQNNHIRIYSQDGIFEEIHQQKIYDFLFMKNLIESGTEFNLKYCFEDFSFRPANKKSNRIHFVLKKE